MPVAGGAPLVKSGATDAGLMMMEKFCVALGRVPLNAVIVPLNVPAAFGVPKISPSELSVRLAGRAPEVTVKVMGVVPDAVQVWL